MSARGRNAVALRSIAVPAPAWTVWEFPTRKALEAFLSTIRTTRRFEFITEELWSGFFGSEIYEAPR